MARVSDPLKAWTDSFTQCWHPESLSRALTFWSSVTRRFMFEPVHIYPLNDLVEHDTNGEACVCGPTDTPVEREDGSFGWLVIHHALDGRS